MGCCACGGDDIWAGITVDIAIAALEAFPDRVRERSLRLSSAA